MYRTVEKVAEMSDNTFAPNASNLPGPNPNSWKRFLGATVAVVVIFYLLAATYHYHTGQVNSALTSGGQAQQQIIGDKCSFVSQRPKVDGLDQIKAQTSSDSKAIVSTMGYIELFEHTQKPAQTGFMLLSKLENVTYVESRNASSWSKDDCAQLILTYDCMRLTFNLTNYKEYELDSSSASSSGSAKRGAYDYAQGYYSKTNYGQTNTYKLKRDLNILRSFKLEMAEHQANGSRRFKKVSKFSPVNLAFQAYYRLSCSISRFYIGYAIRYAGSRGVSYEAPAMELVLHRFDLELHGDKDYVQDGNFSKHPDPSGCYELIVPGFY